MTMQPISSRPVFCSGNSASTFNSTGASGWKPLCRVHKWTLVYFIAQFSSIWKWNDAVCGVLCLSVLSNRNNERRRRIGSCAEKFCRRGSRGIVPCQKGKWAGLKRCPVSQLRFSSLDRSEELFQNGIPRLCRHDPSGHHFKWNQNHVFNSRCKKMIVRLIWQYYRCR